MEEPAHGKEHHQNFKPMAAVGVGGYASGPTLNVCASKGIPCLIQEQNSYAGVTNKLLAKKAEKSVWLTKEWSVSSLQTRLS